MSRAAAARPEIITPTYWDDACRHLARRDRVMKKLIPKFGEARLQSRGDAFTTLARSIVGQQITARAAAKAAKNFAEADRIRQALAAEGVELKDSASGTTWVRA